MHFDPNNTKRRKHEIHFLHFYCVKHQPPACDIDFVLGFYCFTMCQTQTLAEINRLKILCYKFDTPKRHRRNAINAKTDFH